MATFSQNNQGVENQINIGGALTCQQAKKAVKLFESEYMGHSQSDLWEWAVKKATNHKE